MTHGEDAGPETHQDSAVLTYLEGLLMHPVATGPGATATRRSEADRGGSANDEQQRRGSPAAGTAQAQPPLASHGQGGRDKVSHNGGASQHLKKARLLRSGAWGGGGEQPGDSQRKVADLNLNLNLNEQGGGGGREQLVQRPVQDGSPSLGESTLLASLLTTFSSRLQGVAMSQALSQSPKQQQQLQQQQGREAQNGGTSSPDERHNQDTFQGYGTASSRLKGLVRKSQKGQNHHNTSVPYSRRASQDGASSASPHRVATSPAGTAAEQQKQQQQQRGAGGSSSESTTSSSSSSSVSCAERLKAVANLVKTRSSPASTPSPRPSMACSQLALLLSSEAHLQQYSREQALKAQLAGQSASERLAAMASHKSQDSRPPSTGAGVPGSPRMGMLGVPDMLKSLNGRQNRTTPPLGLGLSSVGSGSRGSPSVNSVHSGHSGSMSPLASPQQPQPQPQRERRHFDSRHGSRPPQSCSSLLLLLLNNHNSQKQLTKNGHVEAAEEEEEEAAEEEEEEDDDEEEEEEEEQQQEEVVVKKEEIVLQPPSRAPSLPLDHQVTERYNSPAKSSSDADSYYSSCSPIDLSMRTRIASHESALALSASSSPCPLDKLTETLINKWKPEAPGPKVSALDATSPDRKSHHKVTLMQLLLDRRNSEKVNKMRDNPDLLRDATPSGGGNSLSSTEPLKLIDASYEGSRRLQSPVNCQVGRAMTGFCRNEDKNGSPSPYAFPSPQMQSSPLDLCKSKAYPGDKPVAVTSSAAAPETGFSASKLLQNLAQCGQTNMSPSPPLPLNLRANKRPSPGLSAPDRPASTLLERLNRPAQRNSSPVLEPLSLPFGSFTPHRREPSSSTSSSPAVMSATAQIESLLERRTVLQLLLGSAPQTDKPSEMRSTEVPPPPQPIQPPQPVHPPRSCAEKRSSSASPNVRSNGPSGPSLVPDIKIKTEPEEDSHLSGPSDGEDRMHHNNNRQHVAGCERYETSVAEDQGEVKPEPCPADIVSKYGLLSQLLKQQTSTYNPGTPTIPTILTPTHSNFNAVKEEQQDYHGGPSPKRRRLCLELAEQLTSELCARPVECYGPLNGSSRLLLSPKAEESPARSPVGKAYSQDHQGFNVLKQLLLSDNCLRGLSQDRGIPNGPSLLPLPPHAKTNGNLLHSLPYHHKLSQLPWQPTSPSPGPGPAPIATRWPPTGNGFHESPPNNSKAAQTASPKPVKKEKVEEEEEETRKREEEGEEEKEEEELRSGGGSPDSPRLTRANPILYYMLQQGKGELRRQASDRNQTTHCEIKVKEEPAVTDEEQDSHDIGDYEYGRGHRLHTSQ